MAVGLTQFFYPSLPQAVFVATGGCGCLCLLENCERLEQELVVKSGNQNQFFGLDGRCCVVGLGFKLDCANGWPTLRAARFLAESSHTTRS